MIDSFLIFLFLGFQAVFLALIFFSYFYLKCIS